MPQVEHADIAERLLTGGAEEAVFFAGHWRTRDWLANSAAAILAAAGEAGAIALVARNRPHHVALMAGAFAAGRPLTMVYSAQSSARLASDIARLRRPVVVAEREDWTDETLAAAREAGSAAIAVQDGEDCARVEVLVPQGPGEPTMPLPQGLDPWVNRALFRV